MNTITIKLRRRDALMLGLLTCGNCGYPENNHFENRPRHCAHAICNGYKEVATRGQLIKPKKKKRK